MKAAGIDTASWEELASNCTSWRSKLKHHLTSGKGKIFTAAAEQRARRKA